MVWLLEFGEYWPFIGDLALSVRRISGPSSVVWLLVFGEYMALHPWPDSSCLENIGPSSVVCLLVFGEYWPFTGGLALGVRRILTLHRLSGSWCSKNIWPFIGGLTLGVRKILALHPWSRSICQQEVWKSIKSRHSLNMAESNLFWGDQKNKYCDTL